MSVHYTAQRVKADSTEELYGLSHKSIDAEDTLCGIVLNDRWKILKNNEWEKITCKKCIKWKTAIQKETQR